MNHPNTETNHSDKDSTSFVSRYFLFCYISYSIGWLLYIFYSLQKIFLKEIEKVTKKRIINQNSDSRGSFHSQDCQFIFRLWGGGGERGEDGEKGQVSWISPQRLTRYKECRLNKTIFKLKEGRITEKNWLIYWRKNLNKNLISVKFFSATKLTLQGTRLPARRGRECLLTCWPSSPSSWSWSLSPSVWSGWWRSSRWVN